MPRKKNEPVVPSTPIPRETRLRARGTTPIVAAASPALPHVLEAVLAPSAEDNIATSAAPTAGVLNLDPIIEDLEYDYIIIPPSFLEQQVNKNAHLFADY